MSDAAGVGVLESEARLLSRYLIGREPGRELVGRYVRAEEHLGEGPGGPLVDFVRRHPWALGPLDAACALLRPDAALRGKVLRMAAVLEACPEHAGRFLPAAGSPLGALARLFAVAAVAAGHLAVGVPLLKLLEARR